MGLATGNYDSPMKGELLWVYEGLTEYLGMVLSARSGLASAEDARDRWADVAAWLQTRQGRAWRPLADTAIGAPISYTQASEWQARTRGVDFYDESAMLWLEADALIRGKTGGARSLDDFCRLFYGPPSTAPAVVPYDFNEVIKGLNAILPYDWRNSDGASENACARPRRSSDPRRRRRRRSYRLCRAPLNRRARPNFRNEPI
jgi:predicted metalloprotease with PDZ domain